MGKRLFLICFLFSTISLQAQVELTLDDCIRLGWKQNPEIKNSALRIKGARADYVASIGAFLPRAVVDVTTGRRYGRSIDPGTNGYTTESFDRSAHPTPCISPPETPRPTHHECGQRSKTRRNPPKTAKFGPRNVAQRGKPSCPRRGARGELRVHRLLAAWLHQCAKLRPPEDSTSHLSLRCQSIKG